MERLTKRNAWGEVVVSGKNDRDMQNKFMVIAEHLAELEDKLESGLLIKLPCKVGDTIYLIPSKTNFELNKLHKRDKANRVYKQIVDELRFNCNGWYLKTCDYAIQIQGSFKETWFLTENEAEARLKELKGCSNE